MLLDASDAGLAHDLGVNYAPKLANIAIGDPAAVQTVTLGSPTPQQNPFGPAVVNFAGAPDFSPTRIATPGPTGFPLAKFQPGSVAGPGYSPFIKIAGSDVVYNAPIVAVGNGPFDVIHHTNTEDRVLGIHIAGPSKPGQFAESWADLLFVKGFDAGQPIVYLSTDAGQPLTAVLERSTYVPALDNAAFNGGDDFLGSARERLFGFINGQTGANNPQAQGFVHLVKDGFASQDACAGNTALINALRNGGDLLNVFGDFPTLTDPRHADAYSPLWDAQLGLWTPKAVKRRAEHPPDRRERRVQPGRHPARPADRRQPGHRPARPLRLGRGRHQLRGDRLHRPGPHRQPRPPRPQLPVPATLTTILHGKRRAPGPPFPVAAQPAGIPGRPSCLETRTGRGRRALRSRAPAVPSTKSPRGSEGPLGLGPLNSAAAAVAGLSVSPTPEPISARPVKTQPGSCAAVCRSRRTPATRYKRDGRKAWVRAAAESGTRTPTMPPSCRSGKDVSWQGVSVDQLPRRGGRAGIGDHHADQDRARRAADADRAGGSAGRGAARRRL